MVSGLIIDDSTVLLAFVITPVFLGNGYKFFVIMRILSNRIDTAQQPKKSDSVHEVN